jgi:hypothetical protein
MHKIPVDKPIATTLKAGTFRTVHKSYSRGDSNPTLSMYKLHYGSRDVNMFVHAFGKEGSLVHNALLHKNI